MPKKRTATCEIGSFLLAEAVVERLMCEYIWFQVKFHINQHIEISVKTADFKNLQHIVSASKVKVDAEIVASSVKKPRPGPYVRSPDWSDVQKLAASVMEHLGGPKGAADKLNGASFMTLAILASLQLDKDTAASPIMGP